ncbi:MAG: hypothetical protein ACM3JQ_05825 [Candidatus Eiseniibacteriota bacterium]
MQLYRTLADVILNAAFLVIAALVPLRFFTEYCSLCELSVNLSWLINGTTKRKPISPIRSAPLITKVFSYCINLRVIKHSNPHLGDV